MGTMPHHWAPPPFRIPTFASGLVAGADSDALPPATTGSRADPDADRRISNCAATGSLGTEPIHVR